MKKIILLVGISIFSMIVIMILNNRQNNDVQLVNDLISKKVAENKKLVIDDFIVYMPGSKKIKMYWKNKNGIPYTHFINLLNQTQNDMVFVTNGGIYSKEFTPEGLYIENGQIISELNLHSGEGNFYFNPNGVFYIENNLPYIIESRSFKYNQNILYAVQSGPLLIEHGLMNDQLKKTSKSLKIRSAVGLSKQNKLFFLMSKKEVSFYDFAQFALDHLDCDTLLFLDGTISQMYFSADQQLPEQKHPFVTMIAIE
ncbi:phosphodiester glycosidase family protein [Neisseria sp. Ec49-e6-T10]|uniref:phosphodiester glycosidase family protein n=1 Tax=Neisseria sp. Ec49-e6-T10 TaxID=3140744 RepID=UPI003EBC867C